MWQYPSTSELFCSESTTDGEKLTGLSLLRLSVKMLSHAIGLYIVRSKDVLRALRLGTSGTHVERM